MSETLIDFYDVAQGWSKIPEPYADPNEEGLTAAGFNVYAQAGLDGGLHVVVYSGADRRFLIVIDGLDGSWHPVVAANFASMIELAHKLTPLAVADQIQELHNEFNKLSELLTGDGPPREAVLIRRRQRQQKR